MRSRTLTVTTSHYDREADVETNISVRCSVTPGEPERGPSWECAGGEPGHGPEVEILDALDGEGRDWTRAIEADPSWRDRVEVEAIEAADEAEECAQDERAEVSL